MPIKKNINRGMEMYALIQELYPICRSISGNGVAQTIELMKKHLPLTVKQYPTGLKCFDWEIPNEWNVTVAWIKDEGGNAIVDFSKNNLHVLGYSEPIDAWMSLDELKPHIHTLPHRPNAIPYITSYYQRQWGFCMAHDDFLSLKDGKYHVKIESRLSAGNILVSEALLPGKSDKEILISSYYCHPSIAHDSLSGVAVAMQLYRHLASMDRHYTYRFLFIPETIGAVAYLSDNKDHVLNNVHAGFVVTCVGDTKPFTYKRSRRGNHEVDRITENILKHSGFSYSVRDFWPAGSDERQYCSPGFNLPVGSLLRSVYGEYPEYHTSDDNMSFISPQGLQESYDMYVQILNALEGNGVYVNQNPYCEPQLSKRNLYPTLMGEGARSREVQGRLWLLNYSDGKHSLIDIAEKMDVSVLDLIQFAKPLCDAGLLDRKMPQ